MTIESTSSPNARFPDSVDYGPPDKSVLGTGLSDSVLRIPVAIQVVVGTARLPLSQVTQLGPGALVALDQRVGELAVLLVNGKEIASGELVVLDSEEGRLGITITRVVAAHKSGPA